MTSSSMRKHSKKSQKKSQKHGAEMMEKGDKAHLKAMQEMREIMSDPDALMKWMEAKRKEFEALPESAS